MRLATVAQMTVRACGVVLILLGILFWTGNADFLQPVHTILGLLLVLGLWTLAGIGARSGAPPGLVVTGFVWGLIVPVLGLSQTKILTGDAHWIVQVIHLLFGLGAIGIAEQLGWSIRARGVAAPAR
jgi:hypothetical protein